MKKLFEIELLKLRYSKSTKVIFIIYSAITILGLLAFQSLISEVAEISKAETVLSPLSFPWVWYSGSYVSTLLIIFPAILAILHCANEFSSKIHRQHVIDGLTRQEYVISKFISAFIISAACTLYTALLCVLIGLMNNTGSSAEADKAIDIMFGSTPPIMWIFGYFLYAMSILSFGTLISFLFRRTGRAIGFFIAYFLILEWIIMYILRNAEALINLLPVWSVANNIFPSIVKTGREVSDAGKNNRLRESAEGFVYDLFQFDMTASFIAIIYIVIYFALSRWLFLKRDL